MGEAKEGPDTRFRQCSMGCGRTEWGERPRPCDECRAYLAAVAELRRLRKRKVPKAVPPDLGAAYTRGQAMSSQLRTFRKAV